MTAVTIVAYFLFIFFIDNNHFIVSLCQSVQLFSVLFDITWFFTGIQKFKITVIRNVVIKVLTVFAIFALVKETDDVFKYVLIITVGNLVSQLVIWTQLKRYVTFERISIRSIARHVKPMIILFIPVIAMSLYKYMDKIMLGQLSSLNQLGFYENSEKIMTIPMGVITSLGLVMLPKMANMIANGESEQGKKLISNTMRFIMMMSSCLTFGLIGISPVFAPVFFGEEFRICGDLISYIAVTIFFMAWANTIRSQYLIPNQKDKEFIVSVFAGAAVNLVVNFLLIPRMGPGQSPQQALEIEIHKTPEMLQQMFDAYNIHLSLIHIWCARVTLRSSSRKSAPTYATS